DRIAPLAAILADDEHAFAAPPADSEPDLDHVRNDGDRVSTLEQPCWDILLRHLEQLIQDFGGREQACFLSLGRDCGDAKEAEQRDGKPRVESLRSHLM